MAVVPSYTLDLGTGWLPIPLVFPWAEFADAAAWGTALAGSLTEATPVDDAVRARLRHTAVALQAMPSPLPGAQERFWRTAEVGGQAIIAHLYITDSAAEGVDDLLQLARAGIGGAVQTWHRLEATEFDAAVGAVVVAEVDAREIGAIRYLGVRAGHVFLIDLIEEDPFVLEAVGEEIEQIFRSIQFA